MHVTLPMIMKSSFFRLAKQWGFDVHPVQPHATCPLKINKLHE
jgi:hypothetical protein